ncbi:MAG: RNA 2',3'-cyclic phosphodiesterase [Patescibacteria group bacterium]
MKKRLFVAVPLDETLRLQLASYIKERQQKNFLTGLAIRWTPATNLHLTLCFLGYWEEKYIPAIGQKLQNLAAELAPFSLRFGAVSWGPPVGSPRMIWGIFDSHESWVILAGAVARTLKKVNLAEEREMIPHVTLARFKPEAKRLLPRLPLLEKPPGAIRINSFSLFASTLYQRGPVYTELARFSLGRKR